MGWVNTWTSKGSYPLDLRPMEYKVRGPERVRALATLLRENEILFSVIWVEDWTGGSEEGGTGYDQHYTWYADRDPYPDMPEMLGELKREGVQVYGILQLIHTARK